MNRTRGLGLIAIVAACGACGGGRTSDAPDPGVVPSDGGSADETSVLGGGDAESFGDGGQSSSNDGATCAASTVSAQKALVDIVFIVDTSGSMSQEIAQIKTNINKFSSTIGTSGLDFQVILIASRGTGTFQVCVAPPLGGAACADNPPNFHQIDSTVASTNALSLLLSLYDTKYQQLLRPAAYKVFIPITDDNSQLKYQMFDTELLAKAPAGMFGDASKRRYIFDPICGWNDGTAVLSAQKCSTAQNTGDQYQQLATLTGGTVDSVCKADFSGVFDNIAKGITTKLGCELAVPQSDGGATDPTKVVVQYTPTGMAGKPLTQVTDMSKCAAVSDGWYYDNAASPTKILLCPAECTAVDSAGGGKLDVLLGCMAPQAK